MNNQKLKQNNLGYWEILDKPTKEELDQYYSEEYFQQSLGSYEKNYSKSELEYFFSKIQQKYFVIQKLLSSNKKRLLDVGCGEGFVLSFFKQKGWDIKGLDFSSSGIRQQNPSCLDNLIKGDIFESIENEIAINSSYEVIWLQNVLEHVIDPISLLQKLKKLVSPTGIAVITVPNDFSKIQNFLISNNYIDNQFWVSTPAHLNYFDKSSLVNIFKHTKWTGIEFLADFPVEWFLFNENSNYIKNKSLGKNVHNARINLENFLQTLPTEKLINFWSAACDMGIGRNITAFVK